MDHDRALIGIAGGGEHRRFVAPRDGSRLTSNRSALTRARKHTSLPPAFPTSARICSEASDERRKSEVSDRVRSDEAGSEECTGLRS